MAEEYLPPNYKGGPLLWLTAGARVHCPFHAPCNTRTTEGISYLFFQPCNQPSVSSTDKGCHQASCQRRSIIFRVQFQNHKEKQKMQQIYGWVKSAKANHREWKKIFAMCMSIKEPVYRIYKQLL